MLLVVALILILVIGLAYVGGKDYSAYDEYCKLECWSRRKPCCKTS